jgi:hypothetical protein
MTSLSLVRLLAVCHELLLWVPTRFRQFKSSDLKSCYGPCQWPSYVVANAKETFPRKLKQRSCSGDRRRAFHLRKRFASKTYRILPPIRVVISGAYIHPWLFSSRYEVKCFAESSGSYHSILPVSCSLQLLTRELSRKTTTSRTSAALLWSLDTRILPNSIKLRR